MKSLALVLFFFPCPALANDWDALKDPDAIAVIRVAHLDLPWETARHSEISMSADENRIGRLATLSTTAGSTSTWF